MKNFIEKFRALIVNMYSKYFPKNTVKPIEINFQKPGDTTSSQHKKTYNVVVQELPNGKEINYKIKL